MIDQDRLNELRSEIGDEDLAAVVSVFLDETDEVMARLGGQATAGALAAQLHFLKGSALNLGLAAFATLCSNGEHDAEAGRADRVDLPALHHIYIASKDAYLAALARKSSA